MQKIKLTNNIINSHRVRPLKMSCLKRPKKKSPSAQSASTDIINNKKEQKRKLEKQRTQEADSFYSNLRAQYGLDPHQSYEFDWDKAGSDGLHK